MIKLKNISKCFNKTTALNNISLEFHNGMNFIIGPSGSGKSTLLKILSGFDKEYEGNAFLYGKEIASFSDKEKSDLYNSIIGFVWQDFYLLENYTVEENILLPTTLSNNFNHKQFQKIISDLKINNLLHQKVKELSKGQKQRVAIARELMKEPNILIADEPTSALDEQNKIEIMKILRELSKTKTIIVVTHDRSIIQSKDTVFELRKGKLIRHSNLSSFSNTTNMPTQTTFSFFKFIKNLKYSIYREKKRYFITSLTLAVGVCFLLTTTLDSMKASNHSTFDEILSIYGDSVLDISLYKSFIGANDTSNNNEDSSNIEVEQDLSHVYDKYKEDSRLQFITFVEAFQNIKIVDSNTTHSIESSGNVPFINKVIAGSLGNASTNENEIVIPNSLVQKMGITANEAIGKELTFHGEVTEWKNDTPLFKPVSVTAKVVGVIDTTLETNYEGKVFEYEIEDSFFFNKSAIVELLSQTSKDTQNINILMRAKSSMDVIEIKNELNKEGLVPTGYFEILEDFDSLYDDSNAQSQFVTNVLFFLILIMIIAISCFTNIRRKKEFAIYKICGFSSMNLNLLNFLESIFLLVFCSLLLVILSPIFNAFTHKFFHITVLSYSHINMIFILLSFVILLDNIITNIICRRTDIIDALKIGEQV